MHIPHRFGFTAWSPALVLAVLCVVASTHESMRSALLFDRGAIGAGEVWRLLTAHLVHADATHLLLNLAGLAVAWGLVGDQWRPRTWSVLAVVVALAVGAGLWLTVPALDRYMGASGLLHGLLAAGAVGLWRTWRPGSAAIVAFLLLKGTLELLHGPLTPQTAQLATIVEAHLIGGMAGFVSAMPLVVRGLRV